MIKSCHQSTILILLLVCISGCNTKSEKKNNFTQHPRNYDSLVALSDVQVIERKLSTPNPSKEAEALYRYLLDTFGKKILSGQMCVPWGVGELKYIQEKTGKQPAIQGVVLFISATTTMK